MRGFFRPIEFLIGITSAVAIILGAGAILGAFIGSIAAAAHLVYGWLT
jgi:hypothetical protein